jgi:hypothetical protein
MPDIAKAIAAEKLTVLQLNLGKTSIGVAVPRCTQVSHARVIIRSATPKLASAPRFSVHLPILNPTRFEPSPIQINARVAARIETVFSDGTVRRA